MAGLEYRILHIGLDGKLHRVEYKHLQWTLHSNLLRVFPAVNSSEDSSPIDMRTHST